MTGVTQKQGIFAIVSWVETFLHFLDELTISLSSYLLGVTLLIASADAMTGGQLIQNTPTLLNVFAILQGVGLEAQIRGTAHRAKVAVQEHRNWAVFAWFLLAGCVGVVAIQALWMFGVEHIDHITEVQALAHIHLNSIVWWLERSVLGFVLIFLGKFAPYQRPKINLGTEEELARLKHDLTLNPLRTQLAHSNAELNAARVQGVKQVGAAALRGRGPVVQMTTAQLDAPSAEVAYPDEDDDPEPEPPTSPDKPRGTRGRGRPSNAEVLARIGATSGEYGALNTANASISAAAQLRQQRLMQTIDLLAENHEAGARTTLQMVADRIGLKSPASATKYLSDARFHLTNNQGYRFGSDGTPAGVSQEATLVRAG